MRLRPLVAAAGLAVLASSPALHAQRDPMPQEDADTVERTWPNAKRTSTGIRYVVEREGKDAPPNAGDMVFVLYEGKLLNGTVFDSQLDPKRPFSFRVDRQKVIEGWDQVLLLMKAGEKRLVVIPPELGYGSRGMAPKIPRDATLVFTIELVKIERVE